MYLSCWNNVGQREIAEKIHYPQCNNTGTAEFRSNRPSGSPSLLHSRSAHMRWVKVSKRCLSSDHPYNLQISDSRSTSFHVFERPPVYLDAKSAHRLTARRWKWHVFLVKEPVWLPWTSGQPADPHGIALAERFLRSHQTGLLRLSWCPSGANTRPCDDVGGCCCLQRPGQATVKGYCLPL